MSADGELEERGVIDNRPFSAPPPKLTFTTTQQTDTFPANGKADTFISVKRQQTRSRVPQLPLGLTIATLCSVALQPRTSHVYSESKIHWLGSSAVHHTVVLQDQCYNHYTGCLSNTGSSTRPQR